MRIRNQLWMTLIGQKANGMVFKMKVFLTLVQDCTILVRVAIMLS